MTRGARIIITALVLLLLGAGAILLTLGFFLLSGRTALDTPNPLAIAIAETGKGFLVPADAASQTNTVVTSPEVLKSAGRVYTARCAVCHGGDGKGDTAIGAHIYPRAADLTSTRVQSKTDGTLHWVIGNGLPHTGMPGWKDLLKENEIWELVSYVRQLPKGIPAEPTATPNANRSNSVTVTMENYSYVPLELTVAPGTTVVWVNQDDEDHTVTSKDAPKVMDSPSIAKDATFEFTFTDAGTYDYFCTIHDDMNGVVVVE